RRARRAERLPLMALLTLSNSAIRCGCRTRSTVTTGSETLATPRATAGGEPQHGCGEEPSRADLRQRQTALTATGGWQNVRERLSFRPVLSGELFQKLMFFLDILEGELSGFDEVRHDRLGSAAEQREQVVDPAAMRRVA